MQQRAVEKFVSQCEPIVEKFARTLHSALPQLNAKTFPAQCEQEAKHKFRQALETNAQPEPSPAVLYRLSVDATLAAVREGKQLQGEQAWIERTDDATSLMEKEQRELFARLQAELARLPEQRRRAVALHLISLTTAEIKDLLHWKEPKARDQIDRGWRTLQTKLPGHEVAELTALYQSQPSRTELNRADCLADEFLVRACTGDISDSDRLFVADHLMTCQDCAEEFRLALALKSWPDSTTLLPVETTAAEADEKENETLAEAVTEAKESSKTDTDAAAEITPKWWQALIPRFVYYTGFNLFTAALTSLFFITSLSLATWLVAQHFKHKMQLAQLQQQPAPTILEAAATTEPVTPEVLQARIEEAQKQLTEIQTRITEQNADKVLSNQELLGIQNNTLLKEVEDLSKPQLDAPLVDIDLATLRAAEPGKEIVTTIDVPNTSAVFTVILHKPADKTASNYLLELFDAKKTKPLWSAPKKLEAQTKIIITLAKRNYPAGKYRFTLSSLEGKKKELLETYQLEIKYQPLPKQKKKK